MNLEREESRFNFFERKKCFNVLTVDQQETKVAIKEPIPPIQAKVIEPVEVQYVQPQIQTTDYTPLIIGVCFLGTLCFLDTPCSIRFCHDTPVTNSYAAVDYTPPPPAAEILMDGFIFLQLLRLPRLRGWLTNTILAIVGTKLERTVASLWLDKHKPIMVCRKCGQVM